MGMEVGKSVTYGKETKDVDSVVELEVRQQRVTLGEGYPPDFPLIISIVVFFIWVN